MQRDFFEELTSIFALVSLTAFSWTLGYFANVGIPYYPDLPSAVGAFFSAFLLGWINDVYGAWVVGLIAVWAMCLRLGLLKNKKESVAKLIDILPFITFFFFLVIVLGEDKIELAGLGASAGNVMKMVVAFYFMLVATMVFAEFKIEPIRIMVGTIVLSLTLYFMASRYSGISNSFTQITRLTFPSDSEPTPAPLIWSDGNYIFVAKCSLRGEWTLEGFQGGVHVYQSNLSDSKHRAICDADFRAERERLKSQ